MDKVKDSAVSDDTGQQPQQPNEPQRPLPKPPTLDPRQPVDDLLVPHYHDDSPENPANAASEGTEHRNRTRGRLFSPERPVIHRADIIDLLEKEMPYVNGVWSLKAGMQKTLSFRSLKLVVGHQSENTMMQVETQTSRDLPTFQLLPYNPDIVCHEPSS